MNKYNSRGYYYDDGYGDDYYQYNNGYDYYDDDYEEEEEDESDYYNSETNDYDEYYDDNYYYDNNYYYNEEDNYSDFNYDYKSSIQNIYRFDNKTNFTEKINSQINPNPLKYISQNYLNVLMIAEKPSIARTISKILCSNRYKNNYQDLSKDYGWSYFTFEGKFKGIPATFTISSVAGHLYQEEFLRIHQNDQEMDPGKLYDVQTVKTEASDDTQILEKWLMDLAEGQDILCLWLDCDAEGENICYEVISNTLPYMRKRPYQQIYRAIFSSLSKEDIRESFYSISNYPDDKLSKSVDARGIIDLKVGVSITRLLTKEILPILPTYIKTNVLSYGPCQTPTLWFCVDRLRKFQNKQNKYYKIYLELKVDNNKVKIYLDDNYDDINKVNNIIETILNLRKKELIVKDITTEQRTISHPQALNTANMLKYASNQLGISPSHTMNLAEKLYMKGLISYPRTETTQYSKNYNFKGNLNLFVNDNNDVKELMNNINENVIMLNEGKDMGDHPPITPTRRLKKNSSILTNQERNLYDLICNYYFASLSADIIYDNIKYELNINNITYYSTCSIITELGFSKFLPFEQKKFMKENEILIHNNNYEILNVGFEEKKFEDYITEAELVEEMEKNHIGTDASMSVHIENIVRRGYVSVDEERKLKPTKLGIALIEALEEAEPEIILPQNRAKIEAFVKELADGKNNYENVMKIAIDFYKKKYYNIAGQIDKLKSIFGKYLN